MVTISSFHQPAKPAIHSMHWHQEKEKRFFHKTGITKPMPRANIDVPGMSIYF